MAVIKLTSRITQKARRGNPAHAPGETIYVIRKQDLYFIWAYTDREFAEQMDLKVNPEGLADIGANWRRFPHQLTISNRKSFA